MNKQEILDAIKKAREGSKQRKFKQSFDLVINLKLFDPKKESVSIFSVLPHDKGKKSKVCGFVDDSMIKDAKANLDGAINKEEFATWTDKKKLKGLAGSYDFFVAQANLMPDIAKTFGRFLAPRGKMPNPKSGCVVPPGANLKVLATRLHKSIRLETKSEAIIKCSVGLEDMEDQDIEENIMHIYTVLSHDLPKGAQNIKSVYLKLTMGKPVEVGKKDGE